MSEFEAGTWVHVTLPAVVDEDGDYVLRSAVRDSQGDQIAVALVLESDEILVSIAPAPRSLPKVFGSLILARRQGGREPVLLTLGESNHEPAWFLSGAVPFEVVPVEDIHPGWRRVDSDTLTTLEEM